ncbi:MAG: phospholipase D-like domain-containing protein [Dehalococcoidia bacterium]|nr:phospholipase D-like domain-containing protein [Dehalococcoidia bacterium]
MNILHATTDPTLLARLKEMLGSSSSADIAVGYFFIRGFEAVADDFARLGKVRILVGRTDRQVLDEVALGLQQHQALSARLRADSLVQRSQRSQIAQEIIEHVAEGIAVLPQQRGSEEAVSKLRDMVAQGKVEVRAYLRSPLHAKAYLCWYENHAEPGSAVVGSSNLTLAGFTDNTELNVRVTGDAEMEALREWFDALWKESEDISSALVAELERSWALAKTPPYHVYLKALYELYYTDAGSGQLTVPPRDQGLANFQLDAVRRGLSMIDQYGGCYIGDVVGLGKTFVGAELLQQLHMSYPNDGPPLILCPARLKPMWERFNERFALGAEVVSHSMIGAPADSEFDEELGRYVDVAQPGQGIVLEQMYRNRGPVLVDEAHNFRNINQRSRGLASYLESSEHKVILMSATPQNLGPMDIYRQLRLFLHDTEHGLNIEPISLESYFHNAQLWLAYRAEFENYEAAYGAWQVAGSRGAPPLPPSKPGVLKAEIDQVLMPVFVRRRRKDIRDLYGDTAEIDGKPVRFPDPVLNNVEYRLDKVYAKAGPFDELQSLILDHQAARYRATEYIKEEAKAKAEYRDLFRAGDRIARLMGVLLLKRLESSIEAFRSTLTSLLTSNRNFRQALDAGFVPIGSTATRMLAGQSFDVDDLLEVLTQEEQRRQQAGSGRDKLVHATDDFETDRWSQDLDADYEVLESILGRVKDIGPEDDDKLRALREFLARPEVGTGKVLIFSEAETTVEYLYRELNPDGDLAHIARLTGSTSNVAESVVKRFSPTWNLGPRESLPGPEIQVLLATDVVSEGQNLQDCACVLNYDLHWNPVRLIQRFGRVDRIGTEHEVINLHNMWPDLAVDAELSLTDRLHRRIQSFHDLIGLDSKLLSDSERLNTGAMYRIYQEKALPEMDDGLDEVAANQRAITLLQRIQDEDPALWQTITQLPDGIRSALLMRTEQPEASNQQYAQAVLAVDGMQAPLISPATLASVATPFDDPKPEETLVLLSAGGVKSCYAVDSSLQPRAISPAQLIAAAECGPDTPAQQLPKDTNERVMAAFEAFSSDFQRRLGRARRTRDTRVRRYISRHLGIAIREASEETSLVSRIDVLRQIFLSDVSPQVESALGEIRNMQLEGPALVTRLEALRERYRLNPPDEADIAQSVEPQVIRIVCSDGLT